MWCKMASQLTAEQQQMSTCFEVVYNILDSGMARLPPTLAYAPWSILTATVLFLTVIMFLFMPFMKFLTYCIYTVLLSALYLKYKQLIYQASWSRNYALPRMS